MRILIFPAALMALSSAGVQAQTCVSDAALGTITGVVVDVDTHLTLQGAKVSVTWRRAGDERATTLEIETDGSGRFTVCDVGTGTRVFVRAAFGRAEGRANPLQLEPGTTAEARVEVDAPGSSVTGRVLEDGTNRPIGSASVALGDGGPTVVSGEDGRFTFDDVPPGRHGVRVTHLAFTAVADSMNVELGALTNVNVRMAPSVIPLEPIEVQVRSLMLERAGFYARQERGTGSFIMRPEIEKVSARLASDVLRRQPGLRMVQRQYGSGYAVVGRGNCPFRYFVNGTRVGPTFQIDDMPPEWIEAIEIYRGASTVPIEFVLPPSSENANCGVIAVWTRNR